MKTKIFISLILVSCCVLIYAQEKNNPDIKGKIEVQDIEGQYNIKALAKNNSKVYVSLTYNLLSLKKGKTGNLSSSRQSGKFTLEPFETKKLSETSVNVEKKDALKIYLLINDEKTGKLISKDSLEVNATEFAGLYNTNEPVKEEEIVLEGFTIDETKTKIGELFYTKLFNFMQINAVKFNFITRVLELPTTGRNTQIQVFAEENNVFTFNAMPDEEMMESAVKETIQNLFNYQNQKNVSDKGFIY